MKVLALTSYPVEAAATRYRLHQFQGPLEQHGIALTIHPFVDSRLFEQLYRRAALPRIVFGLIKASILRFRDIAAAIRADVILVQREAMMFGPPLIEWLTRRVLQRPMVLDLDDATYLSYTSPTYGSLGQVKWFGKTDDLIKWAAIVTCGNRSIAEYVSSKGGRARVIPTVVDTDIFCPASCKPHRNRIVLGWIGTHSTFPYLESIFAVFAELAKSHQFRLKIVGSGRSEVSVPGVTVENSDWKLDREVEDFQSIDIGLYPIDTSLYGGKWAFGKSGFKAIQYMAVGIPYVATPVGGAAEIGEAGKTHLFASSIDEWRDALDALISDESMRRQMGATGRRHVLEHYQLSDQADKLADALRFAAKAKYSSM